MGRSRRKKKRTQNPLQSEGETEKFPRSFVIARGKLPPLLRKLHQDLRKLMLPHTALHLKEKKSNSMKDFVHVSGPLGVSHFLLLSHTETAAYLRVARCPRGPTLTFKIHSYALDSDIARTQLRPRAPAGLFKNSPLIVLAGFGNEGEHLKVTTTMFQNIFPAINVNTVNLATCQRVVLLSYDKETKLIEFRHYSITLQPVGVSRSLRKLVHNRKIPDLRGLGDVSEFVTKAGYGSESEAEDDASTVQLSSDIGHLNYKSQKSAVKLQEIGPRMTLQLVKVEEGLCSGAVLFHEYIKKTPEEIIALKDSKEQREALRKQRRAEQEANVKRKELAKQSSQRMRSKGNGAQDNNAKGGEDVTVDDADDIDDADWYRQEVGQEPDAEFIAGTKRKGQKKHAGIRLKKPQKQADKKSSSNMADRSLAKRDKGVIGKVGFFKKGKGVAHEILSQRKRKEDSARFSQPRKKRRTA
ncbi:hypothetical protein GOP47_0001989 [Adiantum capillus-veneris]|uniref:Brix domain-containing protein n=1 Tax=Adiantum capillus-veneris TaxID=13818 RepID=A0A9D4V9B1_ADICA|nr:hypothetical protein GOP47_0001989 [Adiantum capillus-veneris]